MAPTPASSYDYLLNENDELSEWITTHNSTLIVWDTHIWLNLAAGHDKQEEHISNQFISPFWNFVDILFVHTKTGATQNICIGVIRDIPSFCTAG
jgi:hypothetical protein